KRKERRTQYKAAHVYFTKACLKELSKELYKHISGKYKRTMKHINIAFIPCESQVFSLDFPDGFQCYYNQNKISQRAAAMERMAEQIATLCATLGVYPAVRYRADNERNIEFAQIIQHKLNRYKADDPTMGDGPEKSHSQLLVIDRGVDGVSPLLHELTFQAMAYDLLPSENDVYNCLKSGVEKNVLVNENDDHWKELRHQIIAVAFQNISKNWKTYVNNLKKSLTAGDKKRKERRTQYKAAHVYFTKACLKELSKELYKHISGKYKRTMKHINIAFIPCESQVFSLDFPDGFQCYYNQNKISQRAAAMERMAEQIATLCATLGVYPAVRYRADNERNIEFAQIIQHKLNRYKADDPTMGDGPEKSHSQLLVIDRGVDGVSPLLHELTFQAMAYDLLPSENDVYNCLKSGVEKNVLVNENDDHWKELRHQIIAVAFQNISKNWKTYVNNLKKSLTAGDKKRKERRTQYKAAHVYFTKACLKELSKELYKHISGKYKRTMKHINIAFIPCESQVFSLDFPDGFQCYYNQNKISQRAAAMERMAEQIATLCATLGVYPAVRYRADNERNIEFAQIIQHKLNRYKADDPTMGDGPEKSHSQLLVIDRGVDGVSPLLHELTFQAMAYDLLPSENDVYNCLKSGVEKNVLVNENDDHWKELRHQIIAVAFQNISKNWKTYVNNLKKSLTAGDKSSI
ncbi:hypothetical protein QYM36_008574, partial [Artemia franciscana]